MNLSDSKITQMYYDNAIAIVYANDADAVPHILMVVEKNGMLGNPGGKREIYENSGESTARRELFEETSNNGMSLIRFNNLHKLSNEISFHPRGGRTAVIRYLYKKTISPELVILNNEHTSGMIWVAVDYLRELREMGRINSTDTYNFQGKDYKMRVACAGTFNSMMHVLDYGHRD